MPSQVIVVVFGNTINVVFCTRFSYICSRNKIKRKIKIFVLTPFPALQEHDRTFPIISRKWTFNDPSSEEPTRENSDEFCPLFQSKTQKNNILEAIFHSICDSTVANNSWWVFNHLTEIVNRRSSASVNTSNRTLRKL